MAILYPSEENGGILPNKPEAQGYSEEPGENVFRQNMDSGPVKTRVRFTAVPVNIQCQLILSKLQKIALNTFYIDTTKFGSLEFEWKEFDNNQAANYRFLKAPRYENAGGDIWTATLSLERLP